MATLFLARYLVPITSPPVEDGALLVAEGRIVGGDAILLPPLVNAHTHLELSHFPQWTDLYAPGPSPAGFVDWIQQVIRVKRQVTPEQFEASLAAGIESSLTAGTGAVGDILSYFPARKVYANNPLRGHLYLETLGRDPASSRRILKRIGELLDEKRAGQLKLGIAPHSPYSASEEYLEQVFDFARRRKVPTTLHLAESREETAFVYDSLGPLVDRLFPMVGWEKMIPPPSRRSPGAFVEKCGGLVPSCLLAHGVQVDQADVERLARSGAALVCCPRSNARLGVGQAPVARYRRSGVPLALGTDSLASNDSLSIWDELAFAADWFDGQLAPAELLAMATVNGARALGVAADQGELRAGRGCNFQVLQPASLPTFNELEAFLCSPGRSAEVRCLFLDAWDVLQKH
ncbi:MAG: amidohydrolase family protein [Desulfuromonadaceae bacterium]